VWPGGSARLFCGSPRRPRAVRAGCARSVVTRRGCLPGPQQKVSPMIGLYADAWRAPRRRAGQETCWRGWCDLRTRVVQRRASGDRGAAPTSGLPAARSYAELLDPIPNALALLAGADAAQASGGPAAPEARNPRPHRRCTRRLSGKWRSQHDARDSIRQPPGRPSVNRG